MLSRNNGWSSAVVMERAEHRLRLESRDRVGLGQVRSGRAGVGSRIAVDVWTLERVHTCTRTHTHALNSRQMEWIRWLWLAHISFPGGSWFDVTTRSGREGGREGEAF